MSAYAKLADIQPLPIWTGVLGRPITGKNLTLAVVEVSPGGVVAQHQHHNEQVGVVLKGALVFTIGGEQQTLVAGDTYNIPANVPHEAVAGSEGAVVVDAFAPVRDDWSRFSPVPPQTPLWPAIAD